MKPIIQRIEKEFTAMENKHSRPCLILIGKGVVEPITKEANIFEQFTHTGNNVLTCARGMLYACPVIYDMSLCLDPLDIILMTKYGKTKRMTLAAPKEDKMP